MRTRRSARTTPLACDYVPACAPAVSAGDAIWLVEREQWRPVGIAGEGLVRRAAPPPVLLGPNRDRVGRTPRVAGDGRLPIEAVYADVYLWRRGADKKYVITLANRLNPQDPNSPAHLEITLLYGGAVHDQRYIVSVPAGLAARQGWYTVLRYNMTGRDTRLSRDRRVWQDYKFWMWWAAGSDGRCGTGDDVVTAPPINNNAVQTMCASCHLTGWERYQDTASGEFLVRAVNDPGGEMNIDDDPAPDEINVGCESCLGSGSEHVANGGRARFIVNPKYLSAERSSVVCGRCHDRRQGYVGPVNGYTQAISQAGELARPGIRGVAPGRAMPIPYTSSFGTCHVVSELPFR